MIKKLCQQTQNKEINKTAPFIIKTHPVRFNLSLFPLINSATLAAKEAF